MGIEKNSDLKIPSFFMKMVTGWKSLPNWRILNSGISISLAINDYNEKLKDLSESSIKKLDYDNVKLVNSWIRKEMVKPNCRGVPKL